MEGVADTLIDQEQGRAELGDAGVLCVRTSYAYQCMGPGGDGKYTAMPSTGNRPRGR
jgi:hypothetical protein